MKYNINETVLINYKGQLVEALVIECKETWIGNRYTLFLYSPQVISKRWERQILGVKSND